MTTLIEDITSTFNLKLTPRQADMWCKAFEKEDYDVVQKCINIFYMSSDDTPRMSLRPYHILSVRGQAVKELFHEGNIKEERHSCTRCGESGFVIVKRLYKGYSTFMDVAYACNCVNGQRNELIETIDERDIRRNGVGRYIVLNKTSPKVLADTQIWDIRGSLHISTRETMSFDEVKSIYAKTTITSGEVYDKILKEVEKLVRLKPRSRVSGFDFDEEINDVFV